MSAYTAALRGVALGKGTDYEWATAPQGLGGGSYSTVRLQRQFTDGSQPLGPDVMTSREVTFDVQMQAPAEQIEVLAEALNAAWAPVRSGTVLLSLTMAGGDWVLEGRPIVCELDMGNMFFGMARARLVFEATDPRMFSTVESSIVLGLTAGGGIEFPVTFPATFGAGSDSDGTALNAGTFETDWTAVLAGPLTTPRITIGSTGEFVELDGTVPSGSLVVVTSIDGLVLFNGSPRQNWVTGPSRFFKLPAGANTIRFRAASGSGSCTFSWRSAKL